MKIYGAGHSTYIRISLLQDNFAKNELEFLKNSLGSLNFWHII